MAFIAVKAIHKINGLTMIELFDERSTMPGTNTVSSSRPEVQFTVQFVRSVRLFNTTAYGRMRYT